MRAVLTVATAAVVLLSACTSSGSNNGARSTSDTPSQPTSPRTGPSTPVTSSDANPGDSDWPTYHGDAQRTGVARGLRTVTLPLRKSWDVRLDGAVYASPIVVKGMTIVVTESNSVYRIDGNRVIWRSHVGDPVPGSQLPCGNIDPLGMTGTPAYDAATNTVVVVAELADPIRHTAYGFDPSTGRQKWSRSVDVPSSVPGIVPEAMQQRGALLVLGRRVYVPYGGLTGDCSSYRGSVVSVDLDHPAAALTNFTVPTSREAGIWAPPGPVADPDGGGMFVAVGNGAAGAEDPNAPYDHSDSILRLTDDRIVDSFSPTTWRSDNAQDLDLGSQGPALVGKWIFIAGKSGTAYVLDRTRLGGIGGEVSQKEVCRSFGGTAVSGNVVYVPCTDGLRAVRIEANGTMSVLWHAGENIKGSPVVGGGAVWSLDAHAGVLHLLDPATGAERSHVPVGDVSRFATPALSGSRVIIGTTSGVVAYEWR